MSVFSDLDDATLDSEIARLSARIRGGGDDEQAIKSITGEGRKVEYGDAVSPTQLRRLYREAKEEKERREGRCGGTAIGVRFP
jgi:hypothetical protein